MTDANNDAGMTNDGGNQGTVEFPKWMSSLPDAFKSNQVLAQYKDGAPWDKIVQLMDAEKSMTRIPDENASPEERREFFKKLGVPESPDNYDINKPSDFPSDIPFDDVLLSEFKKFAHQEGLPSKTAKNLFDWYYGLVKNGYAVEAKKKAEAEQKSLAEQQQAVKSAVESMQKEWGANFQGNLQKAVLGFKNFSKEMPEAEKMLDIIIQDEKFGPIKLGDHPVFIRVFYNIAQQILGDSSAGAGIGGAGGSKPSRAEIAREMFPYMR